MANTQAIWRRLPSLCNLKGECDIQKTDIEWVVNPDGSKGFTSNPIKGKCLHSCHYCYADGIRKRFQPEKMSWHPKELETIRKRCKPATIFIGSMYDIMGRWVPADYLMEIGKTIDKCPQHNFIVLTKNPQRYYNFFSNSPNCYCGVTLDYEHDEYEWANAKGDFGENIYHHSFVSLEPLLGDPVDLYRILPIDWIIVGALSKNGVPVKPESGGTHITWVKTAIDFAKKHRIPLFLKNNILELYPSLPKIQEVPWRK